MQDAHQNLTEKIQINNPGPASSEKSVPHQLLSKASTLADKHNQSSNRSKLKISKQVQSIKKREDFEVEITNRLSDLDDDIIVGEAMDDKPTVLLAWCCRGH